MVQYICEMSSVLGTISIASDGESITGLWLHNQKYFASTLEQKNIIQANHLPIFIKAKEWLTIYLNGENPDFSLPLAPKGSQFRQSVWKILCQIPYGELTTYGDITKQLQSEGKKASAQAVGGAVGHNPISIIIPCHRVVGSNGSLTSYAGGINKKIELLKLEGISIDHLFIPKIGTAL